MRGVTNDQDRIAAAVKAGRRFLVTSHVNPDGDSIGSQLALLHLLRRLGKEVQAIDQDPVPANFRFLPGAEDIQGPEALALPYDVTFLLDCGQWDRAGRVMPERSPAYGRVINMDHHVTSHPWADLNWVDPTASSTAELVHRLITMVADKPDLEMACCIYAGIITDTGSFRYSNTSSRVLSLASGLVGMGVDPAGIASHLYDTVPYRSLRLLGHALQSLSLTEDGLIASLMVTLEDLRRTGTTWEATEEFVNFPRSIPGVAIAIFFKELSPTETKVSLRSRGRIDVARIAQRHGGGGHLNAAGCNVRGPLAEVVPAFVREAHQDVLKYQLAGPDDRPPAKRKQTCT